MAKKEQKEKSIEETLWESANKLRGSVEPSEYKHVVLSLIFLKYAYDRFLERRNELIADHQEAFADQPVFYNAKNVFYLNEIRQIFQNSSHGFRCSDDTSLIFHIFNKRCRPSGKAVHYRIVVQIRIQTDFPSVYCTAKPSLFPCKMIILFHIQIIDTPSSRIDTGLQNT